MKALKDARKDTSLIEAYLDEIYPTIDTPLPSLRAAKTVIKQAFPVIDASELTPEEIGEADLILKNMESRGGDITIYNNWEYHQDTNIQPRIAPDQGYPFDPNAPRAP